MENDFEDFKTKVLVHLEKLTNAVDALAKATNKVSEAVFGNGDIKTGLMWRVEKMDQVLAEYTESRKRFDEQIAVIKKDLQMGREEFGTLKSNDALQKTGVENLFRLNVWLGWMSESWKHRVFGWGFIALIVYVLAWVAIAVPPPTLIGWLLKLAGSFFST